MQDEMIILCGGDRREIELFRCWKEAGLNVKAAGFGQALPAIYEGGQAGAEDFARAGVLVVPLSGLKADGSVSAPFAGGKLFLIPLLEKAPRGALLLAGAVAPPLRDRLARKYRLVITGEIEELALLNAIPTAEGAIQKAMELSPLTIHGSIALVVGLGRCGTALARALQGLGASVRVLVRRRESAALAFSAGYRPYRPAELAAALAGADYIFNTAPAPLLTGVQLQKVKKEALILDLASAPGGVDFAAAASCGLTALPLPSLPGQAAPRTAGLNLARIYRRLMAEAPPKLDSPERKIEDGGIER